MSDHLLPPSATESERALSLTCAERCAPIIPAARALWDPQTCPAALLPWIAWALSVDVWDATWPEATKRAVVAASMAVHRRKGTVGAMRAAVGSSGAAFFVTEWWQTDPPGAVHTFSVGALFNQPEDLQPGDPILGTTPAELDTTIALIDSSKPVRSHYDLAIGAGLAARPGIAAAQRRPVAWISPVIEQPPSNLALIGMRRGICVRTDIGTEPWVHQYIADRGFDHVRLALHPFRNMIDEEAFIADPAWFDGIDLHVEAIRAAGLKMVLDWHSAESLTDEASIERQLILWEQVAEHFAYLPDHEALFEFNNEPTEVSRAVYQQAVDRWVPLMRETNPTRQLIIGPYRVYQWNFLDTLRLPDDPYLVGTTHIYRPIEFAMQGVAGRPYPVTWGTVPERFWMMQMLGSIESWRARHNVPMYIGEFGLPLRARKFAPESTLAWSQMVREAMECFGWSWSMWALLRDQFRVFNTATTEWDDAYLDPFLGVPYGTACRYH